MSIDWLSVGGAVALLALGFSNAWSARRTHKAVEPNGQTLFDLVNYQHRRNHDMLNAMQRIEAALLLSMSGVKAASVVEASGMVDELVRRWHEAVPAPKA